MARDALQELGSLDFLAADSFLLITDDLDGDGEGRARDIPGDGEPAQGGLGLGAPDLGASDLGASDLGAFDLVDTLIAALGFGNGLQGGTSPTLGEPGSGVIELDYFESAKGGIPGPPQRDPEPEPEPEPTQSYISGDGLVPDSQEFNIALNFSGDGFTQELMDIFISVADYFSSVITNDLEDVYYKGEFYDDITIDASITYIDGSGGILGRAGPTLIRDGTSTDPYLPIAGIMEFDSADVQSYLGDGLFDDIVFHEMTHVLGFSQTVWEYMGLFETHVDDRGTRRPVDDILDYRFVGDNATTAYNTAYGGDDSGFYGVPLETTGGSGTAGSHWDEARFGNEIMTGYINDSNYQGDITLAALDDMGYAVPDYSNDFLV